MRWLIAVLFLSSGAQADVLAPVRAIRPHEVISSSDLKVIPGDMAGVVADYAEVVGKEARIALYPGRPIRREDIGAPALVERNQLVALIFEKGGLRIAAEGRALARGAEGERLRLMNLNSRTTVTGTVQRDGTVVVE